MNWSTGCLATLLACAILDHGLAEEPSDTRFPKHRFVTSSPDVQDMWPCFSPDSQTLLFTRTTDRKTWNLLTVSVDGGTPRPFPPHSADGRSVRQLTPLELNAGHPTWSPDGKQIAFFAQLSPDSDARGLAVIQAAAAVPPVAQNRSSVFRLERVALQTLDSESRATDNIFRPPPEFARDWGEYRSPLKFYDGSEVHSPADWARRRQEILDRWHAIMGAWPPLIEEPQIESVQTERREDFTQHRVRVEVATGRMHPAILLVPDGEGPFPAAVVPYYEAETGAGLGKELRDFGYQLTQRGFVTLSIGGCEPRRDRTGEATIQRLTYEAYVAANCHTALANLPNVDAQRIGIVGHSYGGKWAMFASCLYDKFACAAWSDGGIVFDERRANVNYWEPWYLGYEPGREQRRRGIPNDTNPRTGAYNQLVEQGLDLHELHALMAPRPFLVSGGAEDQPERWRALIHSIAVNELLGCQNRVAMTNRDGHAPTRESNEQICQFFERFLKTDSERGER